MDLRIYEKMLKVIRDRKRSVEDNLIAGAISDFMVFKEQRAKLQELVALEQELKILLEKITDD